MFPDGERRGPLRCLYGTKGNIYLREKMKNPRFALGPCIIGGSRYGQVELEKRGKAKRDEYL